MKHYELQKVTNLLNGFKYISSVHRVDDTIIRFTFDKNQTLYADLKRGNSTWFMCDEYIRHRVYNAPFDIMLIKHFNKCELLSVELEEQNRIMRLHVKSSQKYKSTKTTLQLEFTGRNTNGIILDESDCVIEALRHIDASFRKVSVGAELLPLPPRPLNETPKHIDDIKNYLFEIHKKRQEQFLLLSKQSKTNALQKKLQHLKDEYEKLQSEDELEQKAASLREDGTLILANLHEIKPYQSKIELKDFQGAQRIIELPKSCVNAKHGANMLFALSKKYAKKAKFVYIEKENLEQKQEFLQNLIRTIQEAKTIDEVEIYTQKKAKKAKKAKELPYEVFHVEGYKILVGKSQKSNIALFKQARKNDIWLHVKDIPSSHVLIKTDKQELPQKIINFGAKLCVNFTTSKKGRFLVDYTKWRDVKIESGSNVFYTDYKTIAIDKE